MILGIEWKWHSEKLSNFIEHKKFDEGLTYIDNMDVEENKKERLMICFKSYKESC
jgi:hypothetical protein